jgi:hypothetical protein
MRLILDIARTPDGRYAGCLTVPGAAGGQDFAGVLEMLAILELQLDRDAGANTRPADPGSGTNHDKTIDGNPGG